MRSKDKYRVVGVKFHTTSPKYKTKEYYYKTDKILYQGQEINVEVDRNKKASAIVSTPNYKGKLPNKLKKY